jgi:hypothetical protein
MHDFNADGEPAASCTIVFKSVSYGARDNKDTVLIVCARAGYDDLLFGGRDVGSILVYPQSRATSSLHETEWNNPFNVLSTDSNGFFYQQFIDADGDGDVVRRCGRRYHQRVAA